MASSGERVDGTLVPATGHRGGARTATRTIGVMNRAHCAMESVVTMLRDSGGGTAATQVPQAACSLEAERGRYEHVAWGLGCVPAQVGLRDRVRGRAGRSLAGAWRRRQVCREA